MPPKPLFSKEIFVDGPFAETKELVAGYTIINVKSREEAIERFREILPATAN